MINTSQTENFPEMRGAQRYTLLIRTAKLVCESGEYLCVVRDVSETGVRLKLFHALPADRRMALELANGAVYFIECVWEREGHAGFRFSAPIDVQDFIAEVSPWPKRQIRLQMNLEASLHLDGEVFPARLCDLSQQGARVRFFRPLPLSRRVRLDAAAMPSRMAVVRWRNGEEHGLAFDEVFSLDSFASLAARLQRPAAHHSSHKRAC